MKTIREKTGNAKMVRGTDGSLVPVQPGMIEIAVSLFVEQFGWKEVRRRNKGKECLVTPHNLSPTLRLRELSSLSLGGVHPKFKVFWAERTVQAIQEWAESLGLECSIEEITEERWMVSLPSIFVGDIEFFNIS